MLNQSQIDTLAAYHYGVKVERATATLPQSVAAAIFTVTSGRIIVRLLLGQVTTIIPGVTPCLACLYPEKPSQWKRQFPVIGAVPALIGQIAALEGIKLLTGLGQPLAGVLLYCDTATMSFQKIPIRRRPDCPVCGAA